MSSWPTNRRSRPLPRRRIPPEQVVASAANALGSGPQDDATTDVPPASDVGHLLSAAQSLADAAAGRQDLAAGLHRRWELLRDADDLQAWVIGWPPGGTIDLHDHGGATAVVTVVAGALVETTAALDRGRPTLRSRKVRWRDAPIVVPAGLVHDVANWGPEPALSVHVYSPRLQSMTYWALRRRGLVALRTEQFDTPDTHPSPQRRVS